MDNENQNVPEEEAATTPADVETDNLEDSENQDETENAEETDSQKADKVLAKLQKRIGKEQSKKNEYKDQLEKALTRIEKLEKGQNPDEPEPVDEKDSEIAKLQSQIKKRDITDQARSVLNESGISVPASILNLVVTDKVPSTLTNVKEILTYTQSIRDAARQEFLKGTTPSVTGKTIKAYTQKEFDRMSYQEKADLAKNNPDEFKKLTGGL